MLTGTTGVALFSKVVVMTQRTCLKMVITILAGLLWLCTAKFERLV